VHPNSSAGRRFYTNEQAHELGERVAAAARTYPQRLNVDPDELAETVYGHMIRRGAYPIRTSRDITDLFEAAGFVMESVVEEDRIVDCNEPSYLPADKHKYRTRIVAMKR
jgi:hypothetical protein